MTGWSRRGATRAPTPQRDAYVREWRNSHRQGTEEGYLELEWAPGTAQVDYGNFEAVVAGERLALKLLVVSLPHPDARYARACMSQRSECTCEGLSRQSSTARCLNSAVYLGDGCPISASVPRLAHHAETELDVSTETGLIQIHLPELPRAPLAAARAGAAHL